MSCNAYNHPPDCNCGFGGWWYGSTNKKQTNAQDNYSNYWINYWSHGKLESCVSYVDTNAFCPVCRAHVFFYQSPYGGRVFFDALGPPWPLHPCTSNKIAYDIINFYPEPAGPNNEVKLECDWDPVRILEQLVKGSYTVIKVRRLNNNDIITLGIDKEIYIDCESPIFIREKDDDLGAFDISYLDIRNNIKASIEEKGFRNAVDKYQLDEWKLAIDGSPENQNLVALSILFKNNKVRDSFIDLRNLRDVDLDAAKYWLEKATNNGYNPSRANLLTLLERRVNMGRSRTANTKIFRYELEPKLYK